jgi:hypothetical protein
MIASLWLTLIWTLGAPEMDQTLEFDDIRRMVARQIEVNRGTRRESPSQEAIDRAVELAYREGEVHLASCLLLVMAARIVGAEARADEALLQLMIDLKEAGKR